MSESTVDSSAISLYERSTYLEVNICVIREILVTLLFQLSYTIIEQLTPILNYDVRHIKNR